METKELKIITPEGYEIDRENSTLECIKFKLKIKELELTYEDIANSLMKNKLYYITTAECIGRSSGHSSCCNEPNNATNEKQLNRILALNQLLNIARYYNCNKKNDINEYAIVYDSDDDRFEVVSYTSAGTYSYGVIAVFNKEEDAQTVIDNPNFREILNTVYKL